VGLDAADLLPVEASAQAIPIDWLWDWQMVAISFLFALIVVPMVYSLVVFRRRKGDTTDAEHMEGNTTLEVTWTVVPLFIVIAFAYMGAYSLKETRRADPNAMVVEVTAIQWSWKFEYPDYGITTQELYLPVDKQVVLRMEAGDVLHSFWVPEFRIKQDVVPGRVTEYRVTPILEGSYKVRCAELCGTAHYSMESPVVVVTETAFDEWVMARQAEAAAVQTPEGRGEKLVADNGCSACHSLDGSALPGPTWLGLFGEEVELADGTTVTADEAYLTESIKDPLAKIVAGFQPIMPTTYGFTDEQVADLIAYLKTIK
jgi:cytochrome c oxidase subunit 2